MEGLDYRSMKGGDVILYDELLSLRRCDAHIYCASLFGKLEHGSVSFCLLNFILRGAVVNSVLFVKKNGYRFELSYDAWWKEADAAREELSTLADIEILRIQLGERCAELTLTPAQPLQQTTQEVSRHKLTEQNSHSRQPCRNNSPPSRSCNSSSTECSQSMIPKHMQVRQVNTCLTSQISGDRLNTALSSSVWAVSSRGFDAAKSRRNVPRRADDGYARHETQSDRLSRSARQTADFRSSNRPQRFTIVND